MLHEVVASNVPVANGIFNITLGFRPDGELVAARLEAGAGSERSRCRVRAWNVGGFKTGHQALPRAVESLDGSLWLLGDWKLTVHPAVAGHAWFGCETNGRKTLAIDGATSEHTNAHAASLPADGRASHTIDGGGWKLTFLADAGTVVHVAEWPEPKGALIHCDDAGFSSGTLAIDGSAPSPIALHRPVEVAGRQFELQLKAADGSSAQVRLNLARTGLNLRVSR